MPTVQSVGGPTTYGSGVNVTVTAPAGIVNGEFLLAGVFIAVAPEAPDPVPPPGWQEISGGGTDVTDSGSFNGEMRFFWKFAANESGNYTWAHATASRQAAILRISDVDKDIPFACLSTKNTGNGVTATALGLTTNRDNTLVLFWGQDWGDTANNLAVPTGSTPTFSNEHIPGTATGIQYCASGTLATAGATGNKSHTSNNNAPNNNPWARLLIALNPPFNVAGQADGGIYFGGDVSFVGESFIGAPETVSGTTHDRSTLFNASGTMAAAATKFKAASTLFNASGAMASTAIIIKQRSTLFSAAGTMASAALLTHNRTTLFSSTATMASLASRTIPRSTLFAASGTLTTVALKSLARTTLFDATGTMSTTAAVVRSRSTLFSASGTMNTASTRTIPRTTTFTASGTLATTGTKSVIHTRDTLYNAAGAMASLATVTRARSTLFSAAGTMSTAWTRTIPRSTLFTASGTLTTLRSHIIPRSTLFSAAGALASQGSKTLFRSMLAAASGAMASIASKILNRTTIFTAQATLTSSATLIGGPVTFNRTISVIAQGSMTTQATIISRALVGAYPIPAPGYESQLGVWRVRGKGRTGKPYRIYT